MIPKYWALEILNIKFSTKWGEITLLGFIFFTKIKKKALYFKKV